MGSSKNGRGRGGGLESQCSSEGRQTTFILSYWEVLERSRVQEITIPLNFSQDFLCAVYRHSNERTIMGLQ